MREISIREISRLASKADAGELNALKRSLASDGRSGIAPILEKAQRRIDKRLAEEQRLDGLYSFDALIAGEGSSLCMGLDEVGRGPLAGPLAVGAVVLPESPKIEGLNDSKKIPEKRRREVASQIKDVSIAHTVVFVDAAKIDDLGIVACLKKAFTDAITAIDDAVSGVGHVLLDGNPLHLDVRETSIVKGDGKSASIAAASIIAKVARDDFMLDVDSQFPEYGFAENKGYGTGLHIDAIKEHGTCVFHRKSFCSGILQESLF